MTTPPTALVIGAGLGGLTAAHRLRQAGWRVTVLESEATPGGRARSLRLGGNTLDMGATVMLGSYAETFALIRELNLQDEVERVAGNMAVPHNGQMHLLDLQHPVASLVRTKVIGARSKLALARLLPELLRVRRHLGFQHLGGAAGLDTETLAQFCQRALPEEVYDYLLNPMLKFLYLHEGQQGSLTELLWWVHSLGVKPVYSFKRGTVTLIEALAHRLDVRCGHEVSNVRREGSGVAVDVQSITGSATLRADRCLITVPAPIVTRIAGSALSNAQVEFLASRRYDRTTVVSFITRQRPALDALMVQVPDAVSRDLATLVFQHNIASKRAPSGCGIVNAYFMNEWSERYLNSDDAGVIAAATETVQRLVPEVTTADTWHVHRWRHTAAVTETGACARIQSFVNGTDAGNPIQLVGDYLAQASLNVAVANAERVATQWIRQKA